MIHLHGCINGKNKSRKGGLLIECIQNFLLKKYLMKMLKILVQSLCPIIITTLELLDSFK